MNSRNYRHKLTVQQKTVTGYGTRGEEQFSWTTFCDTWGEVRALTSREQFNLGQRWPDATVAIEMHFLSGMTTAMRVVDSCCSRTFDALEVADPTGKRKIHKLTCREIA